VAQELRQAGWKKTRALVGGWKAWQAANQTIEPRVTKSE
jgi:3-mercaptopyruvate sulfurtransferase SseA